MDPRDFQKIAEELADGPAPAACRSAISRGYYAAFNTGAEFLRKLGFQIGKGGTAHGEVYRCLANSGDPQIRRVGLEMSDLHSYRIRADYHLDRPDTERPQVSGRLTELSAELIRTMDSAFSSPRRPQLQASIALWRKENGYP